MNIPSAIQLKNKPVSSDQTSRTDFIDSAFYLLDSYHPIIDDACARVPPREVHLRKEDRTCINVTEKGLEVLCRRRAGSRDSICMVRTPLWSARETNTPQGCGSDW